ncbi:MAG TPA: Fis family transcriptional regulator [Betaproteobacteria bacterium]|nr:Fis family transcriptional regulator [Betaproteobacteria bacterium]
MKHDNDIAACVRKALTEYFSDLDGEDPHTIYEMVMTCVEHPLLGFVLDHAGGNQTRAAEMLGMNRNTLRKKMKQYGLK